MIKVTIGNNISRNTVIIDENTTLRTALEDNGVDYSVGMTSLDGSTLVAGDLDKTFAEFGITGKCYLLNVVKADNAAKIKIAGGACVVESAHSLESLKKLEKYRPNALMLFEGDGANRKPVFRVGATTGDGNINSCGAGFGVTESNGKAAITMMMPAGTADPKKWAEETIGVSIIKLNQVEAQFEAALEEVTAEQAAVRENITVA